MGKVAALVLVFVAAMLVPAPAYGGGVFYLPLFLVKVVGYTIFAALWLGPALGDRGKSVAVAVGASRAVAGVIGAVMYGLALQLGLKKLGAAAPSGPLMPVLFYLGLLPVRLVEWKLVLAAFYDGRKGAASRGRLYRDCLVCSYLLDVPAILVTLLSGGFSFC